MINFNKFLIADNYFSRIKLWQKRIKIVRLKLSKVADSKFNFIWNIDKDFRFNSAFTVDNTYSIFGKMQNLEMIINWHQDKFSDFVYPLKRFDKINAAQWFDKGIDLVFPWELSRFYFGINLAQKYLITKDQKYYTLFKSLIYDWIKNNPFLYGVNWLSTMDVAIRAVNWIITINYFSELAKKDQIFMNEITKSLIQHAEYISAFPLIEKNGLTTNHTTAAYAGLLFLALTLKDHSKSDSWLNNSLSGLEKCINDQVYEDGVDYEGSIPYHRLVLELFAYSAIVSRANNVKFSNLYYNKLFKMFEFTAAYLDENGNAPQIGDNDSGRLIIFNALENDPYRNEHFHYYLLSLGESLFDYTFQSKCELRDNSIQKYLPFFDKVSLKEINVDPKPTNKSISFEKGGAYLLKNDNFNIFVSCFPIGQNGKGGHNHLDIGSFVLSIDRIPIIVDAGSYCYSKDRKERDKFRSYAYHNTIFNALDESVDLNENGYWSLRNYYSVYISKSTESILELKIKFSKDSHYRIRRFELFENFLSIIDTFEGVFFSRINLPPNIKNIKVLKNKIILEENYSIMAKSNNVKIILDEYEYSDYYGSKQKSKFIKFQATNNLILDLVKGL